MTEPVYVVIEPGLLIGLCMFFGVLVTLLIGSTVTALVQACRFEHWVEKMKPSRIEKLYP